MKFKNFSILGLLVLTLAFLVTAQSPTPPTESYLGGGFTASNFAYGYKTIQPLHTVGATAAGATSITLDYGRVSTFDGTPFTAVAALTPITVDIGASAETIIPSSVSCSTPTIYATCIVNYTTGFANAHGGGATVTSGTAGLQEAINQAFLNGGGYAIVEKNWTSLGGTNAMLSAAVAYSSVFIEDNRGGGAPSYWGMQPTTLSLLATPATLTASTATWTASPAGTWTAAPQFICLTYVDALGGESNCNAVTYSPTPTVSYTLNIAASATSASAGAVGWRLYGGITSQALAYLAPITSANCTLTTLETVVPACAIGSAGVFSTMPLTTGQLVPAAATPLQNVNNPVPQGHTTLGYTPSAVVPVPFQTTFGPFPAVGAITAGNYAVLGSFQLPAGYLNYIGRSVRISGKITATVTTADTFSIIVGTVWPAGVVAGLPTAVCSAAETDAYTGTAMYLNFSCVMTTNAAGTTAVGSLWPTTTAVMGSTAGTIAGIVIPDKSTAVVGSLGLFAQDTFYVKFGSIAQAASAAQLMDLHIETLQ